jgi:hypothetical protein
MFLMKRESHAIALVLTGQPALYGPRSDRLRAT